MKTRHRALSRQSMVWALLTWLLPWDLSEGAPALQDPRKPAEHSRDPRSLCLFSLTRSRTGDRSARTCLLVFHDEFCSVALCWFHSRLPPATSSLTDEDQHDADQNCVLRSTTLTPLWWAPQVMSEEPAVPVGAADLLQPWLQFSAPFESPPRPWLLTTRPEQGGATKPEL